MGTDALNSTCLQYGPFCKPPRPNLRRSLCSVASVLRSGIAQSANLVVGSFHFDRLSGDDFFDRRRKVLSHRVTIGAHSRILATLGLRQDCMAIAVGDRALHIDPGPMHRTSHTACIFRIRVAQIHDFVLQFARKFGTLEGKRVEKGLQLRIIYAPGRLFISFLAVFQRFNQTVQRRNNFFVLTHEKDSRLTPLCAP